MFKVLQQQKAQETEILLLGQQSGNSRPILNHLPTNNGCALLVQQLDSFSAYPNNLNARARLIVAQYQL